MFNKLFSTVTEADIQALITLGVTEGNNLEFKRQVWGGGDEDVREMLRDISAMANAYGGYLIVGMDEDRDTGKANEVIDVADAEKERDRILASCMANLQPRVMGFDIRTIKCNGDKTILLIKVPSGLNLHQITFKGLYQFWKRHDRSKNKMTFDEIKDSITKSYVNFEDTKELPKERERMLVETGKSLIMISVQPVISETELFKINNEKIRSLLKQSAGGRRDGWDFNFREDSARPTIYGLLIGDGVRSINFFRNGYIEASIEIKPEYVCSLKSLSVNGKSEEHKLLRGPALIEFTHTFLQKVEALMAEIGYEATMVYRLSLLNVNDFGLPKNPEGNYRAEYALWKNGGEVKIGPLVYEFLKPVDITKELCDRLWQAFGFEAEPFYKDGNFDLSA